MSGVEEVKGAQRGQRVVVAALAVNLAIAACKLVAAVLSRSSATLAEACHSLADSANQIFLLVGLRRSARPPDREHPFGYGPETYFWAFMVALCIFAVGGGVSIHEGVDKLVHPHGRPLGDPRSAYVVLGASIVLESISLSVALRELEHLRAGRGLRRTLREARDPTVLTVLFEDLAALSGLVVALAGLIATRLTGVGAYDAIASVVVGLMLVAVAAVLARDAQSLLIGRSAPEADERQIAAIVAARPEVCELVHLRTMHLGPEEVIAALKVRFSGELTVRTLEARINELEAELRRALPRRRLIYVEPGFDERAASRSGPA
jgi:cation diffusion facilitator family transporter